MMQKIGAAKVISLTIPHQWSLFSVTDYQVKNDPITQTSFSKSDAT